MNNEYVIEIPGWHPTPLNKLLHSHWATAGRLKASDYEMIWAYSFVVPLATGKRSVEIIITLAPRQRATDPDSPHKSVADGLVKRGLLKNDSHLWVEWLPVRFERGSRKATRIILRDMAPQKGKAAKEANVANATFS